jgi:hypothetical protein
MELIIGFGLGVLGIIAAAASRQLADEFKAWTPWIIEQWPRSAFCSPLGRCHRR